MLRTLWKNVKEFAHKNVRFLPTFVLILVLAFLIPLSFKGTNLTPNIAEAWGWSDLGQSILSVLGSALGWILKVIAWTIFKITGLIFTASGKIFDASVIYSLSGNLYSSFTFINSGWVIIRDLINSIFIFAVLYVALKQLLSLSGDINKKVITNIIIAALLINFSLFFTKAIIDVSNFTSRAIYYTMKNQPTDGGEATYGPANALANGLEIQSILKDDSDDPSKNVSNNDSGGIQSATQLDKALLYFGGSIVHIVCSIIFFAMAFFFVARIIVLIIVMLTSPVYFLSFVLNVPAINKLKNQWQQALIGQAVFPVVFMLIIYVAVQIVQSGLLSGKNVSGTFSDGMGGASVDRAGTINGFAIIINFSIVIALMWFAMKQAKDFAGQAGSIGSKMAGSSAAGTFRSMAFAGRQVGGRVGNQIMKSDKFKGWASSESKFKRLAGDKILSGGKNMYEGTWDVRNSKTLSTVYGAANAQTARLNVGKGGTKTAKANNRDISAMAAAAKSRVTFNNKYKVDEFSNLSSDGKKVEATRAMAGVESYNNVETKVKEAKDRIGKNINEKEFKDYKEKLVAEIRSEFKDDPAKQKELVMDLIGKDAYNKADFAKTRNEISKGVDTNIVKKGAKDIHEVRNNLDAKRTELDAEKNKPPALQDLALINSLQKVVDSLDKKSKDFDEALNRTPSAIKEAAVADIVKLHSQLNKAHLAALNDKMAKGEFEGDEVEELSGMMREMRLNPQTKAEIKNWIDAQVMKGVNGFNLQLTKELSDSLVELNSKDPNVNTAEVKEKIDNIIRVLTRREFEELEIEQISNIEILNSINPSYIEQYARKIHSGNDEVAKRKLRSISDGIKYERIILKEVDRKPKMIAAFNGEKPPKNIQPPKRPQDKFVDGGGI